MLRPETRNLTTARVMIGREEHRTLRIEAPLAARIARGPEAWRYVLVALPSLAAGAGLVWWLAEVAR